MVEDVRPYETMKLRLLNGTHSTLAYLGYLAGCEHVSEVMERPEFVKMPQPMMAEELRCEEGCGGEGMGRHWRRRLRGSEGR